MPKAVAKGQGTLDAWAGAGNGEWIAEYAKSGRSGCRGCEPEAAHLELPCCEARTGRQPDGSAFENDGDKAFNIPKGALRLGVMKFSESASRVVPQWYCKTSFFDAHPPRGPTGPKEASQIKGVDSLSTRDQTWIAEAIRADLASDDEDGGGGGGGGGAGSFIKPDAEEISDSDSDELVEVNDLTNDEIENIDV